MITNLGPKKKVDIPWQVEKDGKIVNDKEVVLKVWKDSYEKLYEVNHKGFDDDFKSKQLDIHQAQREVNVPLNDVLP